jgi:hypothetical protein
MANLTALYEDFGVSEIVKYAFQRNSEAYLFLLQKLTKEAPFFVLIPNCTQLPLVEMEKMTYVSILTSEQTVQEHRAEIPAKLMCEVVQIGGKTGADKGRFFHLLRDLGVYELKVDGLVTIPITDILSPAEYASFVSETKPLRNELLNATLLILTQNAEIGAPVDNLLVYLFDQLKHTRMAAPMMLKDPSKLGSVQPEDFIFPIFEIEGQRYIYWFSDNGLYEDFAEANPEFEKSLGVKMMYLGQFADIRNILFSQPGIKLMFNPGTISLVFDRDMFLNIENLAAGQPVMATQKAVADEDDDPTPDFLK